MESCAFCQIAKKQKNAEVVYEDEDIIAFLDAHPINPGHTLVIPKKHIEEFQEMSGDLYGHLMNVVQLMARQIKNNLKPERVGLWVHGFEVPHTHVHVVPLNHADDIKPKGTLDLSEAEHAEIAQKIRT